MTLPYVHRTAAGLFVSDERVTWVTAVRTGRRVHWRVGRHEPVRGGDVRNALFLLVEQVRPATPYVVTHLDSRHVRHVVLQGPVLDDEAAFDAWVHAQSARLLPPGARLADVVVRVQRIDETEDATRCLLVMASRHALAQRSALLKDVGLRPLAVVSLGAAVASTLSAGPAFDVGQVVLVDLRPEETVAWGYRDGLLEASGVLPYGTCTLDAGALQREAVARLNLTPDRCVVIDGEGGATPGGHPATGDVQEAMLDVPPLRLHPLPVPGLLPAAVMALQALGSTPTAPDFMAAADGIAVRHMLEKREAIRAVGLMAGVLSVLVVLVLGLNRVLDHKQQAVDEILQRRSDEVRRLEQAREARDRLERDVEEAEQLVAERTDVSRLLDTLGRAVPEALWLDAVVVEADDDGVIHGTLTGAAIGKSDVAVYLERLERTAVWGDVRLLYSEDAEAATIHRSVPDRAITRFEIRVATTARFSRSVED